MNKLISLSVVSFFLLNVISSHPIFQKSSEYDTYFVNSAVLRAPDQYVLYWNFTETDIVFKAVVKTTGWMGFGLSPNGGMYNSDLVMAWFSPDGTENLVDAHVRPSGLHRPIVDAQQNWEKLFMKQENGFLTVVFTRKLKVCGQDGTGEINIDIGQQQPTIFAWGDGFEDSKRTFPTYHGSTNRASKFLPILGSLNEKVDLDLDKIEHKDFFVEFSLPEDIVTEYMCHMFDVPDDWYDHKRHVIRYDTLISPETAKYVHHWLIYECEPTLETEYLAHNPVPKPASCLSGTGPWGEVKSHCTKITFAWATGGNYDVTFPKEYGFPIGGDHQGSKHFFVEMHYENPSKDKNVVDHTGIRLYVQEEERPIEFGILTVGSDSNPLGLWIPPKSKHMQVDNICRSKFMEKLYEKSGNITIFAQLPHTHMAGVEFYSKILRNNTEVQLISNNPYYDSNFQYVAFMQDNVVLKKGDEIITTCVYNTEDRDGFTLGGLGTYDEMCLNFIWYYPRHEKLATCNEHTPSDDWVAFFTSLAQKGEFEWSVNNVNNWVAETCDSLLRSDKLRNDPAYTEDLFQQHYLVSNKREILPELHNYDVHPPVKVERLPVDKC